MENLVYWNDQFNSQWETRIINFNNGNERGVYQAVFSKIFGLF